MASWRFSDPISTLQAVWIHAISLGALPTGTPPARRLVSGPVHYILLYIRAMPVQNGCACVYIYIYVCTHIAQRKKAHARIPLPRTIPRRPPSIHSVHKVSYTWATTIRSIAVREGSHHAEWTNKNALSSRDKTIPATQCHIVTNFHKAPTTRCNITTKQLGSERVLPVANSPSNSPVLLTMKNYLLDHSVCATTEGRVDQCPIECCSF